ncbi:hypothetical protein SISNIDRAFT_469063 [Sistotremastrum niveocremeum HHB9708]|uniref:Protein kinase domain-containing protein n=1 Tax=Sistotremastrum niveocremeum HHB9708 TaxID=1314777 RepID=A0A164QMZ3_9AGAM|nr:hypothetical protein SISNIDRAFT_469063 [Sistotremastrum niveocremeum HHB9708]
MSQDIDDLSFLEKRSPSELLWTRYQPWLESLGYTLRRRFRPDWKPSWLTSGVSALDSEDGIPMHVRGHVMDATRSSDGLRVMLKLAPTETQELNLWRYLSSPPLLSDPRNHCVPLLEAHPLPDTDELVLAVMPLLIFYNERPFETMGEVLQCLHTLIEGVVFLHEHNVAHLDLCKVNTMMDPVKMYPKAFHPSEPGCYTASPESSEVIIPAPHTSRTISPVRYYIIDFGESRRYQSYEARGYVSGTVGHSLDVPEFKTNEPFDPFALDIRALGDMIKTNLYDVSLVISFPTPLRN